uniref:Major facilitator superfamily (MFS) profile domain-containing protein n=1 Tax=Trichogramma kaykai TaxID=54128 RepID=A0ABD2WW67_9HYME
MSNIDFDEVLLHVGEKGRYQNIMYYLLCIPATLPAAFLVFSQVFVSATPDHWCRIPELHKLRGILSLEDRKALSLPYSEKKLDGRLEYDKCTMYDVNYTEIVESWLGPDYDNVTAGLGLADFADTGGGNHSTTDSSTGGLFSPDGHGGSNLTSLLRFPRRLPPPPVGNPNWTVVKCRWGWEYDTGDYDSTLVTELDLVCDKGWWPSTSTTFFFVGSLFGNVVFGWIADKWGRRTASLAIIFFEVIFSIATSFSPNYVVYTALRTINGLFFPAIYQIPFILGEYSHNDVRKNQSTIILFFCAALELMGPKYRTFAGMVICIFFATAMTLLALLSYLLRHWYSLSLAISVPFVLLFSYYWIIPESPRWLLSKNRIDEAEEIVQTMARVNGKTVPPNFLRTLEMELQQRQRTACNGGNTDDLESYSRVQPTSATPMDILKNPNIRKKFFILAFDWIANAVVYNGLSYNVSNLGVSDYLAFFIGGLVEIPSYVVTWYAMDRIGRRWVLCSTMLLGGVACLSCMLVPEDYVWVTVTLAMVGKFGIAASFAVFYVFVGELLPTVLRSQAMGIASFVAGIGLLAFPYIVSLAVYSKVLPLIIMGTLSVAGSITSIFLPETLNIHLPQTVEEGERFGADFKLWSCPTLPSRREQLGRRRSSAERKSSEFVPLKCLVNGGPDGRNPTTQVVEVGSDGLVEPGASAKVSAKAAKAAAAASRNGKRNNNSSSSNSSSSNSIGNSVEMAGNSSRRLHHRLLRGVSSSDEEQLNPSSSPGSIRVPPIELRRAVVIEGPAVCTTILAVRADL